MRIGLIGDNSLGFVEKLLDIWNESNCVVIIDWRMPFSKIEELFIEASVVLCYIDEELAGKVSNVNESSISYITYEKKSSKVIKLPQTCTKKYINSYSKKEALILYSSGTTGRCKGVILSFYAISTNADMISAYMKLAPDDAIYIAKTLSHSSTIVGELLVALKIQCNIYLSATIVPPKFTLANIEEFGITTLCLNPSLLSLYCKTEKIKRHQLTKLKAIYVSGSILEIKTIQDFHETFENIPLLNVYGLTEAGPRVTAQTVDGVNAIGSVGKPIGQVKIKIENWNEESNKQIGLIKVKTPSRFQGYVSSQSTKIDKDGWINTGDVGYLDANGNLFVVGRQDNMMLIGSHNVFPEEIENYLVQSGLIDDCIIYSISDSINGEKMVCKYVSDKEVGKKLQEYCLNGLAPYEIPKDFQRIDNIEKTYNSKKKRTFYGD